MMPNDVMCGLTKRGGVLRLPQRISTAGATVLGGTRVADKAVEFFITRLTVLG